MSPLATTRWCPTPEQLMILEQMYKGGIKTPTASQIQQITAHLSVFGKIEGKNVFYWFQNHKARDRQKLRRKLISKQQQQQQQSHHFLHQFEASGSTTTARLHQFHPYNNSPSFLPQQEGLKEAAIPQVMMNYKKKMNNSQQIEEKEKWVWLRGQDNWMNMTNTTTTTTTITTSTDPAHSSCCTRPLITLELFPIKSTSLKDENCTTSNT